MFRAYVDQSSEPAAAPGRTLIVGLAVAIIVLAVLALILVVA
jgi:hypothetical protein